MPASPVSPASQAARYEAEAVRQLVAGIATAAGVPAADAARFAEALVNADRPPSPN